jgi:Predicted phosphoesterases, related to the Icc protein
MKLWIVSDLHLSASPWSPAAIPDHDLLIVAGDVADDPGRACSELFALTRLTGKPIIFVPGNHDLGGVRITHAWTNPHVAGVTVLPHGEHVEIDNVRFVGATLWTDWHLTDTEFQSQSWAARAMPEYRFVGATDGGKLWPIHTSAEHDRHLAAIEAVLARPFDGPTVVITHHAPSAKSCSGEWLDESDAAFASDLEPLIERYQPALWVHGHIHKASDYTIGGTRIVCNPRGYQMPGYNEATGFREDLVIYLF